MKKIVLISSVVAGTLNIGHALNNDISVSCDSVGTNNITQCVLSVKNSDAPNVYAINNMPYALCSKALCTLNDDGKFANCKCDLENEQNNWQSLSLSPTEYNSAKPTMDNQGNLSSVQSNYSMANLTDFSKPANNQCKYDKPKPWANCYGVRCNVETVTLNGKSEQVASCVCPVNNDTSFLIGASASSACNLPKGKVWSATTGASLNVYGTNPMNILYKKLYPQSPPVKK